MDYKRNMRKNLEMMRILVILTDEIIYFKYVVYIEKQRHYFANKGPFRLWFFQWSCMDMRVGL